VHRKTNQTKTIFFRYLQLFYWGMYNISGVDSRSWIVHALQSYFVFLMHWSCDQAQKTLGWRSLAVKTMGSTHTQALPISLAGALSYELYYLYSVRSHHTADSLSTQRTLQIRPQCNRGCNIFEESFLTFIRVPKNNKTSEKQEGHNSRPSYNSIDRNKQTGSEISSMELTKTKQLLWICKLNMP